MSNIFTDSALTIFDVFRNITNDDGTVVKKAKYVEVTEDWDDVIEKETDVEVILDNFTQEDVQVLTFSKLIQNTDVKGLVPGDYLLEVEPSTKHVIRVNEKNGKVKEYAIVDFDTDPAKALYTFLLRRT